MKNKRYTYSDNVRKKILLEGDNAINEVSKNILFKQYEEDLKKEYPGATLDELKKSAVKKYKDEYYKIKNNVIAPLYEQKVTDVIKFGNKSVILKNSKNYDKDVKYAENTQLPDIYTKMNLKRDLFDKLEQFGTSFNNTSKSQTGSQLISNVIGFDKINYSYTTVKASQTLEQANKAYDFFKKSKKFMTYDYETMGGVDEYGYKRVDALTEFAYTLYDKASGKHNTVSTIVGISEEQEKRFRELIKTVNKQGIKSNQQDVIYRRIGMYGHKDTKLIKGNDGMYDVKSIADLEYGHRFTDTELDRGFKRLRQIYDEQNKLGTTTGGLYRWQERYAQMIGHMNDQSMSVLDYNGVIADRPWQNKFLATMGLNDSQKAEFTKLAGINDMFLDTTSERFYDVRVHTRYAGNNVGSEAYYPTKEAKERLKGNTPFSQEGIARTLFADDFSEGGAHTAGFDTRILGKLAIDKTGFGMNGETFVDRIHRDANATKSNIINSLRGNNLDLLMANQSYNGGNSPLSYVYDPVSKAYRTANQYAVGDTVSKEFTKENAIKRGRMYTLGFAGQVDMTDDWVKGIDGLHDEFAQKSLYAIRLNPFYDESIAGSHQGLRGHSVMFFNSKEQMESSLSNMLLIGQRDNATNPFNFLQGKAGEEVKELLRTHNVIDGQLIKGELPKTVQEVIAKATYADVNDTAARMIREDSYSKAMNFSKLYGKMNEFNGGTVNKKQAHQLMLNLLQSQDRKLSKKVASGEVLELSYADVQQALGYALDNGKSFNLITNTLNNQMAAFDYMASQNDIFQAIKDHFYKNEYNADQHQFKFENILNQLMEDEINLITKDPKRAKELWHNSSPTSIMGKDLNYFNFDTRDFFKEKAESSLEAYTKPIIDEDILRIDLGPGKEYNFVNNLLRKTTYNYSDMTPFQKENEGISQLRNFVSQVRDSKQYGSLFEQFNEERISSYNTSDMFANSIIQELRDYRKADPTAGYLAEAYTQDAGIRNKVLDSIKKRGNIFDRISKIDASLPEYVVSRGDRDVFRTHAQKIVDNILVDQIDPFDYAKQYGLSDIKAKHLNYLYGKAKEEYADFLTDFMESFTTGSGVGFTYDPEKKTFALMNNSQKVLPIDLPKLKAMDGNFFVDMGTSSLALHAKIDATAAIKNGSYKGARDINVITTLGDAFRETSASLNLYKVAKKGDNNNDILRRAQSVMQNMKANLRTGSAVDYNDILDLNTPYRVDFKDIYGLAPLLKQNKLLENRPWRDAEFLNKLDIKKTFDNSDDAYREIFQKNIPELLRVVSELKGGFNEDTWMGVIAKNLSFLGKETQGAEAVGMIEGYDHRPGAEQINNMRPVINQNRSVLYRTSEWEKAIASGEFSGRNIGLKPITTSDASRNILNRELTGIGKTSIELQVGKLNISEMHYRAAISDHFSRKGALGKGDQKVLNKLKSVNLTEQEQVLDPRVATKFFDRIQEQKISTRKELSFYLDINQNTIETTKEFMNMMPTFEFNKQTGQFEFKYGKGVYKNRHDKLLDIVGYSSNYMQMAKVSGKFNQGYFSKTDGMLIKQDDINSLISGFKTEEEARTFLKDTFNEMWYVKGTDRVTYKKILNGGVEKGMADILAFGLGEGNESIEKYIKATNKGLFGKVATDEFIQEEILDKFNSKIGSQVGIRSKEELKDLIYKEMYQPFDTLRNVLGKDHDFSLLANHSQGSHKNTQLGFEELVGTMKYHLMKQDGSLSENDAMQKVFDDLTSADHKFINIKETDGSRVYLEDGVIHFPNHLKGGKDYYDNKALAKILDKDEYSAMKEGLRVKYGDTEVGNFVMTGISEARDAQWMSGHTDPSMIKSIADLKQKAANATGDEKRYFEQQAESYASALQWNTKGQKITDREIQMLDFKRYDQDMVDLMQSKLDTKTFESTMDHVLQRNADGSFVKKNDKYVLKEEDQGRSILSEMTDSYRDKYIRGQGGVTFDINNNIDEKLKKSYKDEHVQAGIRKLVAHQGTISKDTAEHLYSTTRGVLAVKFNNNHNLSVESMQKEGFNVKKASELYRTFDQGKYSLEHPDSFFNKNLILDFGEEFKFDSERYVALPYAPSKMTGDTVVRNNFQKKLSAVLGSHDRIQKFNQGINNGSTKEQLLTSFRKHQEELIQEVQLFSATGKKGNMGQFNIRLDQSFVGKASGIVALNPLELAEYGKRERLTQHENLVNSYDKVLARMGGNKEKALEYLNYAPLSQSKFNGKSILKHYAEGSYLNVSYGGKDIFEEMGILSKEYLAQTNFKNMDELKKHLSTEGIVVNAIRTPTIKMDSTAPARLYLDDTLKGRKVKTLLEPSLARTEDYDGDQPIFSVFKSIKGHDSITALKAGTSDDRVWKDINADMINRSVGTYSYFHDKTYQTLFKDAAKSFQNGNFLALTGDQELDGKLFAEFNVAPTSEGIAKHQKTIDELQSIYEGKYGERFNLTNDKHVTNLSSLIEDSGSNRQRYMDAAIFDQAFAKTEVGANAKVRKTAIGEINNPLARLRRTADLALPKFGKGSEKRDLLQKAFEDIEQEVISAKKGSLREYWDKTSTFKSALSNLMSDDTTRKSLGRESMSQWLDKNMTDAFAESFQHIQAMRPNLKTDDAFGYIKNTFLDVIGSFDSIELQKLRQYDTLGSNIKSFGRLANSEDLLSVIPSDTSSLKSKGLNIARETGLLYASLVDTEVIQKGVNERMNGMSEIALRSGDNFGQEVKSTFRKGMSDIAESVTKSFTELTGSKLGLASVGLAAAYMITGFIGSNASQPSDLQAQQMATQQQGNQMNLSDYGQSYGNSVPQNSGYVVNVRGGGSPQTIARSQQSISQAMSNSIDSNINVKMNIMESNGNINDRYLDELLVNAIG